MVIYDPVKFKTISQIFMLVALVTYFIVVIILKYKKIQITYGIALKLFFFVILPIVAFPFIFLSTMSLIDKIISTLIVISGCLIQFYGTMAFHKLRKKVFKSAD
jgi:hypothetical protein